MLSDVEVATPERVALGLPVAGVGYRILAYLVDLCVLFAAWVVTYFLYSLVEAGVLLRVQGLSGLGWTLAVLGIFATQWLYWTVSEVVLGGQTLGKRALGVRVVRSDGSPVGFFESAVRNLCRVIDFFPAFYAVGVVSMLVTERHLRVGDLLAGTVLVRQVKASVERYADLGPTQQGVTLGTHESELVLDFLSRAPTLEPATRARLGILLWRRLALSTAAPDVAVPTPEATEEALRALLGQSSG